jgi:hypothetical protein
MPATSTRPSGSATPTHPEAGRPAYLVIEGLTRPSDVAAWIEAEDVRVLKVARNRESIEPGIGERVERFLVAAFHQHYR